MEIFDRANMAAYGFHVLQCQLDLITHIRAFQSEMVNNLEKPWAV